MRRGRVYLWTADDAAANRGSVRVDSVDLARLDADGPGAGRLSGQHVTVRNAGVLPGASAEDAPVALGDASADPAGDFHFDPSAGGPRVDRGPIEHIRIRERARQAARFGEVNSYYHLDRMAAHVDTLLRELGAGPLPRITAVVHAHPGVFGPDTPPDGVQRKGRLLPFQGGHYRLPGPRSKVVERDPVSPTGEIHLGPGWELVEDGALAAASGRRYRHNASHNAGILYHEYGHHVVRHTADFRRNADRPADMQDNRKSSLEEGICDYWAATLLDSPYIWAWHRKHDDQTMHRRTLTSAKTLADFDAGADPDLHANGTIWAAALWDARRWIDDPRKTDLLLVRSLLLWRQISPAHPAEWDDGADSFRLGLALLLRADAEGFGSRHAKIFRSAFSRRGIEPLRELAIEDDLSSRRAGTNGT